MTVRYDFSVLETPTGNIFPLGQEGETGGSSGNSPAILDLNESGEYVGRLIDRDSTLLAFSSTGGNFNIGPVNSQALGINDNNVVVGQRPDQFSTLGGFQTRPDGPINGAPSPTNGGIFDSATFDINNDGVHVGQSIGGRPYRANLDGNFIQTLTDGIGVAYDINEFDQVVGQSDGRAFFTNRNFDSEAIDLGTLREDNSGTSRALALNDFSNSAGDFIEFVGEASIEGGFDIPESGYDESIDGELSNNQAGPTPITLSAGNNIIAGDTTNDPLDRDFFTFVVPEGFIVSDIILQDYQWGDGDQSNGNYGASYFAITEGNSFFSIDNDSAFEVSKLVDNFAAEGSEVGQDLLEPGVGDAASGNNRLGSGELGPGTYTVWYQETGANTTYAFNVVLASSYDESIDGDLSNNQSSPTPITLTPGDNIITGNTTNEPLDRDFFTFVVPEGATVSDIILQDYQWGDGDQSNAAYGASYFAITEGNSFSSIDDDTTFAVNSLRLSSEFRIQNERV